MAIINFSASWRGTDTINPDHKEEWVCRAELLVTDGFPGPARNVRDDVVHRGKADHRHRWQAEYEEIATMGHGVVERIKVREYCELCDEERWA